MNPRSASVLCEALASSGGWAIYVVLNDAATSTKPRHTLRAWIPSGSSNAAAAAAARPGKLDSFVRWALDRHGGAARCGGGAHLSGLSNGGICAMDLTAAAPRLVASVTAFPGKFSEENATVLRRSLAALAATGCRVRCAGVRRV